MNDLEQLAGHDALIAAWVAAAGRQAAGCSLNTPENGYRPFPGVAVRRCAGGRSRGPRFPAVGCAAVTGARRVLTFEHVVVGEAWQRVLQCRSTGAVERNGDLFAFSAVGRRSRVRGLPPPPPCSPIPAACLRIHHGHDYRRRRAAMTRRRLADVQQGDRARPGGARQRRGSAPASPPSVRLRLPPRPLADPTTECPE